MPIAADYPFMDVLWTMIIFFCWVVWIWIMVVILLDVFRRRDIGGWTKALWVIFLIILPFLGALIYLIAQHDGMAERSAKEARGQQQQFDEYVRSVSGGSAAEIEKAKTLLDNGTITQDEFNAIKAKALAA
jgi:putative oligomerization/nucleic acid binding protein/phospholipase D-like protein